MMSRYIMASRRAGKFAESEKRLAHEAVGAAVATIAGSVSIVSDVSPPDPLSRRIVILEAEPEQVAAIGANPDFIIEPEILHWTETLAGSGATHGPISLDVQVLGEGKPLSGATVHLFLRDGDKSETLLE